jgi:pimeloyl-ACP methyl ester carboxylesterase
MVTVMGDLMEALEGPLAGVVASSFGSFTTIAHQVAHPEKTLPSVHFGCPALAPRSKVPLRFLLQGLPGMGWLMMRMQPPTLETATKLFAWIGHEVSLAKGRIPQVGLEWYAALLAHTSTRKNDFAMFGNIRPGRDQLTEQDLGRVSVPTSFFWGEDDMFGGADVARHVAGAVPGAALELVAESGHLPWLDFPEMAAEHVRDFFRQIRA